MIIIFILGEMDVTYWWSTFIVVHLIFIFYFAKVHRLIFRKHTYSGGTAVMLSILGAGIGQAYNRQLVQALISFGIIIGTLMIARANPDMDELAYVFMAIYAIITIHAGMTSKKAQKRAVIETRNKQVNQKIVAMLNQKGDDEQFAVDTNILMHEPDLLLHLLERYNMDLYMSMMVFNELDGLKKSENIVTRTRAQTAFDIIEEFQRRNKLHMLKTPKTDDIRKYGLGGSPDEKIIGTYLREREKGNHKLLFVSNDKGARILARNVGMPIAEF